jgi:hypothetical protein
VARPDHTFSGSLTGNNAHSGQTHISSHPAAMYVRGGGSGAVCGGGRTIAQQQHAWEETT